MSLDFSIREFELRDFETIGGLFSRHFPPGDRLLSRAYTRWLYLDNPHGPARIVTASESGVWIGFLALVPVRLAGAGEQRKAYYIVNVLVDPRQRGKNLFGQMIQHVESFALVERAILIGHPNAMAIGAWRRAGMRFLPPLKPFVVAPSLFPRGATVMDAAGIAELAPAIREFSEQERSTQSFHLEISPSYIDWRYFKHPTNCYRLRRVEFGDERAGFMVTRRIKPGFHLLIDHFMRDGLSEIALSYAPILTIAFQLDNPLPGRARMVRAPIKKQLPWFFSDYAGSPRMGAGVDLGLSVTEF